VRKSVALKPLELHPAVHLAWLIANREASLAAYDCVTPAYVLLGVLKILDDCYDREAEAINLDAEELEKINDVVVTCRPLLHMSEKELTAARRGMHMALQDNNSVQMAPRVRMLQWSGDSLYLYQKTVARAINSQQHTVTLVPLLEELLENLPPQALPFFQNHPTAHPSASSSGDGGGQIKYDSLLWRVSDERDED
jgi:hypothetical protein